MNVLCLEQTDRKIHENQAQQWDLDIRHYRRGQASFPAVHGTFWRNVNQGNADAINAVQISMRLR